MGGVLTAINGILHEANNTPYAQKKNASNELKSNIIQTAIDRSNKSNQPSQPQPLTDLPKKTSLSNRTKGVLITVAIILIVGIVYITANHKK